MMSLITINDLNEELFSPPTLAEICAQLCVANAKTLILAQPSPLPSTSSSTSSAAVVTKTKKLRRMAVNLPMDIWEQLIQRFDSESSEDYVPLVHVVYNNVPLLRKIHLRNCLKLKDEELGSIISNFPMSLDIHNCPSLTKRSLEIINKFGKNLECLCIGNSTQILPVKIDDWLLHLKEREEGEGIRKLVKSISKFFRGTLGRRNDYPEQNYEGLLTTKKLRKLVIWGHHITQEQPVRLRLLMSSATETASSTSTSNTATDGIGEGDSSGAALSELPHKGYVDYWEYLTRDFIQVLEYLDLSSCQEIVDFTFLLDAKESLRSLHLHDVLVDVDIMTWGTLRQFTKLRFLDLSQYNELASLFANPDVILDELVTSLPNLVGMDISGTNLAGFGPGPNKTCCSINGLSCRFPHRPLHFLGLLGTHYYATQRANIPALQITGGDTMDQLICSIKAYMHRGNILHKAIRILHEQIHINNFTDFIPCYTILDLLLQVMTYHMDDKHIMIVSLAAAFHLIKRIVSRAAGMPRHVCSFRMNKACHIVVRGMEVHSQDLSILRNGVLNMLVLGSYLKKNSLYGDRLFPVLLQTGIIASSKYDDSDPMTEIFLLKSVIHLLYTFTHSEKKEIIHTEHVGDIVDQMCVFMDQLNSAHMMDEIRTLWIILLKWISESIKYEINNIYQESNFYNGLGRTRIVEHCFELVKVCNELVDEADPLQCLNLNLRSLREILKPVLAFLTNLLYNATTAVPEEQITKSDRVQQLLEILDKSGLGDDDLLHACCGLLAMVASRYVLNEADEGPTKQKILDQIYKTMFKMNRSKKFLFTFRNLNLLYELRSDRNAPEIQYWANWTLLKLAEDDAKFVNMIIGDAKLGLNDDGSVHRRRPPSNTKLVDDDDESEDCSTSSICKEVDKLFDCLCKVIYNNRVLIPYKEKVNK